MSDKSIQDQIGMAESFEEALRLITENPPKDGKPNIKPLPMDLITADPAVFQGRMELCQKALNEYRESLSEGRGFPALVVFCDTSRNAFYLVDGYHRWTLYGERQYRWCECEILFGSKEEAIEYAVSANIGKYGVPLTALDKKKSAWMLLALPGWLSRSTKQIADKLAISYSTANSWIPEYIAENNLPRREVIECKNGKKNRAKRAVFVLSEEDAIERINTTYDDEGNPIYFVGRKGSKRIVGRTLEEAKANAIKLYKDGFFVRPGMKTEISLNTKKKVGPSLARRGVIVRIRPSGAGFRSFYDRDFIANYWYGTVPIVVANDLNQKNFSGYYGDADLSRGPERKSRGVVLCYLPVECDALAKIAAESGVDFMSPEQFISWAKANPAESA